MSWERASLPKRDEYTLQLIHHSKRWPSTVMPRKNLSLRNFTLSPKRPSSPGPPSPTFSDTTHASAINFGVDGPEKIITRANLKASLQSYDEVCMQCLSAMDYSGNILMHRS